MPADAPQQEIASPRSVGRRVLLGAIGMIGVAISDPDRRLAVPLGTVRSRIHRGRRLLRESLT